MKNLMIKELRLCLHPLALVMLVAPLLVLIPGYPGMITYFYMTIGVFMISLKSRENNDMLYSLTLPVTRKQIVKSRMLMINAVELTQALIAAIIAIFCSKSLYTLASALLFFGIWNLVYFSLLYKIPTKVGISFAVSCIPTVALIICDMILFNAVPFLRENFLTPDPANIVPKLIFLLIGIVVYAVGNLLAYIIGNRQFEKQDLK